MATYAARDFVAAADALGKILDADPSSLDARYYLGVCHLLTGGIESEIAELRKVIEAGDTSPYAEPARFYLAKAYLKQGYVNQARTGASRRLPVRRVTSASRRARSSTRIPVRVSSFIRRIVRWPARL